MAQLFGEELLNITLKFATNKRDIVDADKLVSKLSLALDGVVRGAVKAGKSIGDVVEGISHLDPVLKSLEKRSGNIGASASVLRQAQSILSKYTPDRIEKMAETAANRIAETSGTASLRREIEKLGSQIGRLIATQEGRYDRATKGSSVGRGLFIDTETTGLNALKHQVVELTATLFTFNKQTGEILNQAEKTYHGLQQLEHQSRHQYIPTGLSAESLKGQAISSTRVRRLMDQADFVVAHNAQFDKKFVEKLVPQAAQMQWLDSMRGIGWRQQGFSSRAQQDLMRAHGISAGTAHRTEFDVSGGIRLLSSRSPLGGGTYLSQLLGNQGSLNTSQQVHAQIEHMAKEMQFDYKSRLGESRSGYGAPAARYRTTIEDREANDIGERFAQYVLAGINNPTQTVRGKQIPVASLEGTPGQLGNAALSLDRRLGTIDTFLRNMAVMSGPMASSTMVDIYTRQARHQEGVQQAIGRGRQVKDQVRHGEGLALATMAGVNTSLDNERSGIPAGISSRAMMDAYERQQSQRLQEEMAGHLSQPWAQPTRQFTQGEVREFINKNWKNPDVDAIGTSAQMANSVDKRSMEFGALSNIMLGGQKAGRTLAADRRIKQESEMASRLASTLGKPSGFRNIGQKALEMLRRLEEGGPDDPTTFGMDFGLGGAFSAMGGGARNLGNYIRNRFTSSKGGQAQQERILSYEEQARNLTGPLGSGPRGEMRWDRLQQNLDKLASSAEAASSGLSHYKDILEGKKQAAGTRAVEREFGISQTLAGTNLTLDSQRQRLQSNIRRSKEISLGRIGGVQGQFESRSSSLGFSALDASLGYETAVERAKARGKRLSNATTATGGRKYTSDEIQSMLAGMTRPAEMRNIRAQYAYNVSQLTDQGEIDTLRSQAAAAMANARYQGVTGQSVGALRQQYAERIQGLLGGPTLAQRSESKTTSIAQDQIEKEKLAKAQLGRVEERQKMAEEKANRGRLINANKLQQDMSKIEMDGAHRTDKAQKIRADAEKKAHEARLKYVKNEAALGGRGGGGGTGSGGSGGGGEDGGGLFGGLKSFSRSGYGFGVGLAALSAFDTSLKELIKDSAIYAARVQTMQFSTQQMAKVSGLNAGEVTAEVEAIKKMNVTTAEANSVAQKMIMTQQDLAKSTGLVRVAQDLAAISGQDAMEVIDRLMTGVVTGYTRNLHMMGLQVTSLSAMRQLKSDRAARGEKGEPTETERREAIVNQILQQGAKFAGTYEKSLGTAGGQFAYLSKEANEASLAIGNHFLPAFGNVVGILTDGLKFVQAHGDAFAHLASVLSSLGATASALGSVSFIKWMMGSTTPIGIGWKVAAAAVGLGAYTALEQDPAKASAANRDRQIAMVRERMASTTVDVNALTSALPTATGERSTNMEHLLAVSQESLKNWGQTIEDFKQQHIDELAKIFIQQQKDYGDKGIAATSGRLLAYVAGGGMFSNRPNPLLPPVIGGNTPEENAAAAKRVKEIQSQPVTVLPEVLRNQRALDMSRMDSELQEAQQEMAKLDEKVSGGGALKLQKTFERGLQTPRQRIEFERQQQLYPFQHAGDMASKYQEMLKGATPEETDHITQQIAAWTEVQKDAQDAAKEINADAAAAQTRLTRERDADIIRIRAQSQEEMLRSQVIKDNYESERKEIQATYDLQIKTAAEIANKTGDTDEQRKSTAQAEEQKKQREAQLSQRFSEGILRRQEVGIMDESQQHREQIFGAPGLTSQQAINKALDEEIASISKLSGDESSLDKMQEARIRSREMLKNLAREEAEAALNRGIEEHKQNIDLYADVSKITSARQVGADSEKQALDNIELQRKAEIKKIDDELQARKRFLNTPEGQASLGDRPRAFVEGQLEADANAARRSANVVASQSLVGEIGKQIDDARARLADSIKERAQIGEQILRASESEETGSIEHMHEMRLKYIQEEFEARGQTLEAEREKNSEILQAESDKLSQMLDLRKKQVDEIRGTAEQLFETITTNHASGLRNMLVSQIRGMGAKIFGNIAVDLLKGPLQTPTGSVSLQDLNDLPLYPGKNRANSGRLGRILAGTPFGPGAPSDKEIQAQLARVTDLNTEATNKNTDALDRLDDLLDRIVQGTGSLVPGVIGARNVGGTIVFPGMPRAASTTPSGLPALDLGGFGNNVPLYGGSGGGSPYIFHMAGSGTMAPQTSASGLPLLLPAPMTGGGFNPFALSPQFSGLSNVGDSTAFSVPGMAASSSKALQMMLANTKFAKVAAKTTASGVYGGSDGSGVNSPFILSGFPGGGGSGGSGGAGGSGGNPLGNLGGAGKYIFGSAAVVGGTHQALTSFGKGARGDILGVGGILQAAAGISAMIPGGQLLAGALEAGALGTDLIGSMFMDPRQKRSNQVANYLGLMQYLSPAQIAMTSSLGGNMVSEGKGGLVSDSGIAWNALQVQNPYLLKEMQPSFTSNPLSYLLGTNKPSVYQVSPGSLAPFLPANYANVAASQMPGNQQYDFAAVPGQVLYNDLPANATVPSYSAPVNVQISTMDAKSFMDNSENIAAAVQKQLQIGNGLSQTIINSVFGQG